MCFHDDGDYDWIAAFMTDEHLNTGPRTHCLECGKSIAEDEFRRAIYQQQSDGWCIHCDDYPDDFGSGVECEADACDFVGETWAGDICRGCCAILVSIRRDERKENCPPDAQQPRLGMLSDELSDHVAGPDYARRAVARFPSLAAHPVIVRALTRPARGW